MELFSRRRWRSRICPSGKLLCLWNAKTRVTLRTITTICLTLGKFQASSSISCHVVTACFLIRVTIIFCWRNKENGMIGRPRRSQHQIQKYQKQNWIAKLKQKINKKRDQQKNSGKVLKMHQGQNAGEGMSIFIRRYLPVWPDWAIFESSWWQIFLQK